MPRKKKVPPPSKKELQAWNAWLMKLSDKGARFIHFKEAEYLSIDIDEDVYTLCKLDHFRKVFKDTNNRRQIKDLIMQATKDNARTSIAIELLHTANFLPVKYADIGDRLEVLAETLLEGRHVDDTMELWEEELEAEKRETFSEGCPIKTWLRVSMDRAPEDPEWIEYCRYYCTDRLSRMTWDFPVPIGTTPKEVLERIIEDTGYKPRFYEIIDNKGPNPALIPNGHRVAPITASAEVEVAVRLAEAGYENEALEVLEAHINKDISAKEII